MSARETMRKRKKRQAWGAGDVFVVEQRDGLCSLGQVIELLMPNVVSCAFYDIRVKCDKSAGPFDLPLKHLIATLSLTREQLDFGEWKVVGHEPVTLDRELWPNDKFRTNRWIGSTMYDASIAEKLLDAYNALVPWDDWGDPAFLDKLLASPERKPMNVLYKKK